MTTTPKNRRPEGARYLVRYWLKGERTAVDATVATRHSGHMADSWADCEMCALRQIAFQAGARRVEVHGPGWVDVLVRTKDGDYVKQAA